MEQAPHNKGAPFTWKRHRNYPDKLAPSRKNVNELRKRPTWRRKPKRKKLGGWIEKDAEDKKRGMIRYTKVLGLWECRWRHVGGKGPRGWKGTAFEAWTKNRRVPGSSPAGPNPFWDGSGKIHMADWHRRNEHLDVDHHQLGASLEKGPEMLQPPLKHETRRGPEETSGEPVEQLGAKGMFYKPSLGEGANALRDMVNERAGQTIGYNGNRSQKRATVHPEALSWEHFEGMGGTAYDCGAGGGVEIYSGAEMYEKRGAGETMKGKVFAPGTHLTAADLLPVCYGNCDKDGAFLVARDGEADEMERHCEESGYIALLYARTMVLV